jgi:translocation and assembly module TamB
MRVLHKQEIDQKSLKTRHWQSIFSAKNLFFSLFSGSLLLGSITGASWGTSYTQAQLVPQIAQLLQETLDRPVQLGKVERVSLTGVRLGASAVPATATDRDTLTVEAIDVQFNPLDLVWKQKIELTITLIQPKAFIDQDETGWLNLDLDLEGEELVEVKRIRLRDATIELAGTAKPLRSLVNNPEAQGLPVASNQVTFQQVHLDCTLTETPELEVNLRLSGQAEAGGTFRLRGQIQPTTNTATFKLKTTDFDVTALNPILPPTARFDRGILSSQLTLQVDPEIDADIPIDLDGKATLKDLAVQVEGEPNLFTQTSGRFRFQGQEIWVSNGQTAYGQIPFEAIEGTVDLEKGLNLKGRVASVSVPAFLSTFDLPTPFPTTGTLQSLDLTATGPIAGAIFAGTVKDVQPVWIDRVELNSVLGKFIYDTGADRLQIHSAEVFPKVGGIVSTQGLVILGEEEEGEPDDVMLEATAKDVPSDAIARLYGMNPLDVRLGQFQAKAKVSVISEMPDVQLQWQLTEATYPAQGAVSLKNDRLRLQDTRIQVGDGWLDATGELLNDRWQFGAQANNLPLHQLPNLPDLPGTMQSTMQLAGTIDRPLQSAQGTIQAQVETPDGDVNAEARLAQGRWQAQIDSSGMALDRLSLPGVVTGNLKLAGPLAILSPKDLQAIGQIQLSQGLSQEIDWLNQPLNAAFQWDGDRLEIQQAEMAGLEVNGSIATQLNDWNWQPSSVTGLDLNVQLQDHDLATLPLPSALPVAIDGLADFRGRVTGTPIAPDVDGILELQNFAVNQLAFEPSLRGTVQFTPDRGLAVNLRGQQDHIALDLDDRHRLQTLTVKRDQATAQAVTRSGSNSADSYRLLATVQQLPLEWLHGAMMQNIPDFSGLLSGRFNVALGAADPTVIGEIAIDRPALGPVKPSHPAHAHNRFVGKLHYDDRSLSLNDGQLRLGNGTYQLAGQLNHRNELEWSGQLTTDSGRLQDWVTMVPPAQWQAVFNRVLQQATNQASHQADRSQSSTPNPVQQWLLAAGQQSGLPIVPTQEEASPSPRTVDLSQLQGTFATQINLQQSPVDGMQMNFALQGQDWRWGDYGIQEVTIANGWFDGKQVSLAPAQLRGLLYTPANQPTQTFDTSVHFSGQMGDRSSGQVAIDGIPAALLGRLLNLPIPLGGDLHAIATLAGSSTNPEVAGTVDVLGLRLNARQLRDLQVVFRYHNQQFQIEDWRLLESTN